MVCIKSKTVKEASHEIGDYRKNRHNKLITFANIFVILVNVAIFAFVKIAIMTGNNFDANIIAHFMSEDTFTKTQFSEYIFTLGMSNSDEAVRAKIFRLKKKGFIKSIKRGVYKISDKPIFEYFPDKFIKRVNKLFLQQYSNVDYCMWNSHWLHDFMNHQPNTSFYILEVDKNIIDSVFYYFKDLEIRVFNNPNEQMMEDYVLGQEKTLLLKPYISRSPISIINKIPFAKLEKVLVDIFCDSHQFFIYSGQELKNIYNNAFSHYSINVGSLYNYALRRGKKKNIAVFIEQDIM